MIVVFIAGYILVKSRKSGSGLSGLFKGKNPGTNSNMDDLITLMMLQQLTSNSNSDFRRYKDEADTEHEQYIEKVKQEALALLDD